MPRMLFRVVGDLQNISASQYSVIPFLRSPQFFEVLFQVRDQSGQWLVGFRSNRQSYLPGVFAGVDNVEELVTYSPRSVPAADRTETIQTAVHPETNIRRIVASEKHAAAIAAVLKSVCTFFESFIAAVLEGADQLSPDQPVTFENRLLQAGRRYRVRVQALGPSVVERLFVWVQVKKRYRPVPAGSGRRRFAGESPLPAFGEPT